MPFSSSSTALVTIQSALQKKLLTHKPQGWRTECLVIVRHDIRLQFVAQCNNKLLQPSLDRSDEGS